MPATPSWSRWLSRWSSRNARPRTIRRRPVNVLLFAEWLENRINPAPFIGGGMIALAFVMYIQAPGLPALGREIVR